MDIFLPIRPRLTGGTSAFARKFQEEAGRRGDSAFFNQPPRWDVLMASPRCPPSHLVKSKFLRRPIVHRLDGVYYPTSTSGWVFPIHNASLAFIYQFFADAVVWQSRYSQASARRFLGARTLPEQVIYNGVDLDLFSPHGPAADIDKESGAHVLIATGRFRARHQTEPLIRLWHAYRARHHQKTMLVFIGDFANAPSDLVARIAKEPLLYHLPPVPHQKLVEFLRAGDVFVMSHLNPPCPNNVIEAMACGMPICGIADGAMPELVTENVGRLLPVDGDGYWRLRDIDYDAWARLLADAHTNRQTLSVAARARAEEHYSLTKMYQSYRMIFEGVLNGAT